MAFLEAALGFFELQHAAPVLIFDCAPRGGAPFRKAHALATATAAHRSRILSIFIFRSH
jgi:hypothetical protein